jgi:hypothetical protein
MTVLVIVFLLSLVFVVLAAFNFGSGGRKIWLGVFVISLFVLVMCFKIAVTV